MKKLRNISYIFLSVFISLIFHPYSSKADIEIVAPTASDTIYIGETVNIRWTGTGNDPVTIEYSSDHGNTWNLIADNVTGDSYLWDVPYLDSLKLNFRVRKDFLIKPKLIWERLYAHENEIRSVRISPDGAHVLSAGDDETVYLWEIGTRQPLDSVVFAPGSFVFYAKFLHNKDSALIAVDKKLVLWDRINQTTTDISSSDFNKSVKTCAAHPTRSIAACASWDPLVKIYDLKTGMEIANFDVTPPSEIHSITFSPSGDSIAYTTADGRILIRNWKTGDLPVELSGHGNQNGFQLNVWSADFSPGGKFILSGGVDKTARYWDIENASLLHTFDVHNLHVRHTEFHPGGRYAMSASLDDTIRQFIIPELREFEEVSIDHGGQIISANYSPTGDTLVSAGRIVTGYDIKVWKNFEFTSDRDTSTCNVRYRAVVSIPHIVSQVGKEIEVPLNFKKGADIPEILSKSYNIDIEIIIPNQLLFVQERERVIPSSTRKDTVRYSMNDVILIETMDLYPSVVVQGDTMHEEILISKFKITNDSLIIIDRDHGSIRIEENCIGKTDRTVGYTTEKFSLEVKPNPVSDEMTVKFNAVEDGMHKLFLSNINGMKIKSFIDNDIEHGIYEMSCKIDNIPSGAYILNYITPTEKLSKTILIIK